MIGRKNNWDKMRSTLQELLDANSCGFMVIFGDYGMGKSFTLKKIEESISKKSNFIKRNDDTLAIMLKTVDSKVPSNYLIDLLTRIMRSIGKEQLMKLAKMFEDKNEILDSNFRNVIQNISSENELALDWLFGRNLSKTELQSIGCKFNMNNPKEISLIFSNFLKFLKICNYGNLVLLLDEWEYLLSIAGRSKLLEIVHELQNIYDSYNIDTSNNQNLCNVVFIIGASADAWQKFLEMVDEELSKKGGGGTQTFLRRIPHEAFIELSPMTDKDVKEFLIDRLNNYKKKPDNESLYPFEDDYVKYISAVTQGIPSRVLRLSALILKTAVNQSAKKIDAALAEKIVRSHGLYSEYVTPQSV